MFCSNCGAPDQAPNSYCRKCGEFLAKSAVPALFNFGGSTPQQNVRSISFLSLMASVVSLIAGTWMYLTNFNVPIVLYFAAAILLCNAGWHLSNFFVGMKLNKRYKNAKAIIEEKNEVLDAVKTSELLPAASELVIPHGITENTTRNFEKIRANKK